MRCWAEINLGILRKNLKLYRKQLNGNPEIMAVVKADAYGHGDRVVAKYLSDNGIRSFAVSNIDEAIHVREAGAVGQILVLGYTPLDRLGDLLRFDITQTLLSEEYAEKLALERQPVKCQFAIDTGMRRIGLNAERKDECERVIRKYAGKLQLNGLFTHLCVADTPEQDSFTETQIALFREVCASVEDLRLPYLHCLNSAGGIWHEAPFGNLVRLGIIMYGLKPDYMNTLPSGIEPVLSWKSVVSMVKRVDPGDTIGYGRSFVVNRPMTIATVPVGYADGFSRQLSNKGWVLIHGYRAPIVGRICMDQMMVDVTDIPNVSMETEVVLLGKSGDETLTADDLAHLYGTIGYEIICGISKRVDRIYIE